MPTEPDRKSVARRVPRARYRDDGPVFQEIDGFDNLTPEQKLWPMDPPFPDSDPPPAPPTAPGTPPSPPG